ncbi:BrnT family toxin [Bosea sp. PAMC 26642]|uniref:BrnT family toxin n=1 Tax=Bosea sp. (strain PAMC 26642) TaxID=1792307 RepID=UPI000A68878E|nr:BrnT family toxin [Bosea sp. PAMC 26642]
MKNERNIRARGLPFALVDDFAWETAETHEDRRFAYPEPRFVSSGLIGSRVFVVCFTPIPDGIRVISFRKANAREVAKYEQSTG